MDEYEISLPCTLGVTLCATGDKLIAVKKKVKKFFRFQKFNPLSSPSPDFFRMV